jgi:hypothetical protein
MRREDETFTVYDKDGHEQTITEIWAHTADDVALESELFTMTPEGVLSHVTTGKGKGVYRVIDNGEILTEDPPAVGRNRRSP